MSNIEMWSGIAGFLLPPVIAVVQQQKWQQGLRAVVTFLICLAVAAITVFIQYGNWHGRSWVDSALTILVAAIATYHGFWKPTGVAPSVENATTPK